MTPVFISRSFIIVFSLVAGMSIATNAETVKVTEIVKVKASTDGSFALAQTNGTNRRQDRRGDRQDCRQQEGVGADKRNCKQQGRQTR